MKVQRFESILQSNKVFSSHSNKGANKPQERKFYDIDSVDEALKTDSIDDPLLPQIARKFSKAFHILFPAKVVEEANVIKSQIDEIVDNPKFQAVA